jgi:hypothetical protein
MIPLVRQPHPHRTLAHLRRELVRRLAHNSPLLSGGGASGKRGAAQTGLTAVVSVGIEEMTEAKGGTLSQLFLSNGQA